MGYGLIMIWIKEFGNLILRALSRLNISGFNNWILLIWSKYCIAGLYFFMIWLRLRPPSDYIFFVELIFIANSTQYLVIFYPDPISWLPVVCAVLVWVTLVGFLIIKNLFFIFIFTACYVWQLFSLKMRDSYEEWSNFSRFILKIGKIMSKDVENNRKCFNALAKMSQRFDYFRLLDNKNFQTSK